MALVNVWVSSPDTHSERRIPSDLTVAQLKYKLDPITGIPAATQSLTLRRTGADASHSGSSTSAQGGDVLAVLDHDDRTLDSYGIREYMTIRVDSNDPHARGLAGQFADDSQVDKFELTEEEYAARRDTVLQYKKLNQLGRFAPSSPAPPPATVPADLLPGARCEVALSPELRRRGTVRFVGPTDFGAKDESTWVGVEWDEPVGKGDGAVDGKRYFQTAPLRASFVRPDKVKVGDYPELDPFAELDEDEADDEEMEM
ncbi:tubulin-folding cofactor B [Rhodotorula diobovata]|uniref:Tubulin-folding cofactor B n=1 Tax=Rhodotorula diobovata TaxID=5288 RepID=A0A5C5FVM4_9BASI|nr:tubulin-folding cofactor B [Rhodotorula diobovata]